MDKIGCVCKVAYMLRTMAVAGKHDGKLVFPAAAEDFRVIGPCVAPLAIRGEGSLVDLEDYVFFSGAAGQSLVIHGVLGIVAVSEDFYLRVLHGVNISKGIFFFCATFVILGMHTGNPVVKSVEETVLKIKAAVSVKDVQLHPVKELKAKASSGGVSQTPEIRRRSGGESGGTVIGNSQKTETPAGSSLRHVGDGSAGSVAAGDGMCVYIGKIHIDTSWIKIDGATGYRGAGPWCYQLYYTPSEREFSMKNSGEAKQSVLREFFCFVGPAAAGQNCADCVLPVKKTKNNMINGKNKMKTTKNKKVKGK